MKLVKIHKRLNSNKLEKMSKEFEGLGLVLYVKSFNGEYWLTVDSPYEDERTAIMVCGVLLKYYGVVL